MIVTVPDHVGRFDARPVVVVGEPVTPRPGVAEPSLDVDVALIQLTSGTTGRPKPVLLEPRGVRALLDNVIATLRGGAYWASRRCRTSSPCRCRCGPGSTRCSSPASGGPGGRDGRLRSERVRPPGAPVPDPLHRAAPRRDDAVELDDESITSLALEVRPEHHGPLSPLQARRFRDRFGLHVLNYYGQTEIGGEIIGWAPPTRRSTATTSSARWDGPMPAWRFGPTMPPVSSSAHPRPCPRATPTAPTWASGSRRRVVPHRRCRAPGRRRLRVDRRAAQRHDQPRRPQGLPGRGGGGAPPPPAGGRRAAVVGAGDDRLGEVPWAFVVPSGDTPTSPASTCALCREHLAPYKVPARYEVVDELRRNEMGKVLGRRWWTGHGRDP